MTTTAEQATATDEGSEPLHLTVDGIAYELPPVAVLEPLLAVLRDELGVTAPKEGCGTGVCGACTVLVDGRPLTSCTLLAGDAAGSDVTTAAGCASGRGADVARCLVSAGGVQCGFCSPGFVVSITALLDRHPDIDEPAARMALAGNLCRCTGYARILAAVALTQAERREGSP